MEKHWFVADGVHDDAPGARALLDSGDALIESHAISARDNLLVARGATLKLGCALKVQEEKQARQFSAGQPTPAIEAIVGRTVRLRGFGLIF